MVLEWADQWAHKAVRCFCSEMMSVKNFTSAQIKSQRFENFSDLHKAVRADLVKVARDKAVDKVDLAAAWDLGVLAGRVALDKAVLVDLRTDQILAVSRSKKSCKIS